MPPLLISLVGLLPLVNGYWTTIGRDFHRSGAVSSVPLPWKPNTVRHLRGGPNSCSCASPSLWQTLLIPAVFTTPPLLNI